MDTTTKLKELFKKYMALSPPVDEEEFANSFYHNLEYLRVRWLPDERRIVFDPPCGHRQVVLLDLFYGQEERLALVASELAAYIAAEWDKLMEKIVRGTRTLRQQGAIVGRYVLPWPWRSLVTHKHLLGAAVTFSDEKTIVRIESISPLGRFLEV